MTQPINASHQAGMLSRLTLAVFWCAFAALATGLALWVADHASGAGNHLLMGGLAGLVLMPLLRLLASLLIATRQRDWLLLWATLAVLSILSALTLRDAARFR